MSEKRIAVVSILVSDRSAGESINELLSRYGEYILGRMGIPYREKNISVLSVVLDAPGDHQRFDGQARKIGKCRRQGAVRENMREQRTKKEKKFL